MPTWVLMRHGKSDWGAGEPDFSRPLNSRGEQDAARMGRWIVQQGFVPDLVLCSPAARASSTAMLAGAAWGLEEDDVDWQAAIYGGGALDLLESLRAAGGGTKMLVGHNPGMDGLVEQLAGEPPRTDGKLMVTAAVAVIEADDDGASGRLLTLTRPKDLP